MATELPWGIYNKYTEEWWKQTNDDKPMVFPTEQAARNFVERLAKEDGQHCDEDEAFITQSVPAPSPKMEYCIWHNEGCCDNKTSDLEEARRIEKEFLDAHVDAYITDADGNVIDETYVEGSDATSPVPA